jgi:hypothetical protein
MINNQRYIARTSFDINTVCVCMYICMYVPRLTWPNAGGALYILMLVVLKRKDTTIYDLKK